jgi:hypothetical protein
MELPGGEECSICTEHLAQVWKKINKYKYYLRFSAVLLVQLSVIYKSDYLG